MTGARAERQRLGAPRHHHPRQHRVRRDRVDTTGKVTLCYRSQRHLRIGRRYAATRVLLLVADRDLRVINDDHERLYWNRRVFQVIER